MSSLKLHTHLNNVLIGGSNKIGEKYIIVHLRRMRVGSRDFSGKKKKIRMLVKKNKVHIM